MKQIKNYFFLFLVLIISSCNHYSINPNGLVGGLDQMKIDKRTCFESAIQPVINEKIESDQLIDSIKFRVLSYDFFEMQRGLDSNGYYFQRIDIEGITRDEKKCKAIIIFTDCDEPYRAPLLLDKNTIIKIKLYYPLSSLNKILKILGEKQSVMLHYQNWKVAGTWAAISYHDVLIR